MKFVAFCLLCIIGIGCSKPKAKDNVDLITLGLSLQNTMDSVVELLDEGAGVNYSDYPVVASNCQRTSRQTCQVSANGTQFQENVLACDVGDFALHGKIKLQYNASDLCTTNGSFSAFTRVGAKVVRTLEDVYLQGPLGQRLEIAGQQVFERISNGSESSFRLQIDNNRIYKNANQDVIYNFSLSAQDLIVKNQDPSGTSLLRNGRKITSGTLTYIHHQAGFTAQYQLEDLQWEGNSCCFPKTGQISVIFSGNIRGSGSLRFRGEDGVCGKAVIYGTQVNREITLNCHVFGENLDLDE